jgi:hypothetical protein
LRSFQAAVSVINPLGNSRSERPQVILDLF